MKQNPTEPRRRAPGGGRKQLYPGDPTERRSITLPRSLWEKARGMGQTVSEGVRRALEQAK